METSTLPFVIPSSRLAVASGKTDDWLPIPATEARVPHISLVFREMWDTTVLDAQLDRLSSRLPRRGVDESLVHFPCSKSKLNQPALGRERGVGETNALHLPGALTTYPHHMLESAIPAALTRKYQHPQPAPGHSP
jgi:hypothetical protein